MVDSSQGHSAYSKDALLASRMNMNPGGKQSLLRDGWFMKDGVKIVQNMVFPCDHKQYPNMAKGMKQVLLECGLWKEKLHMECKEKCESKTCCAKQILTLQPDFAAQKSLIQEIIEDAGHLCIFLPKFHCELNFIEYFWSAVKNYLCENCDYSFAALQMNMPKALGSVELHTIRKWEQQMKRWMDAYRGGLAAKEAQMQVKAFSSKCYSLHRRVPEMVAMQFD